MNGDPVGYTAVGDLQSIAGRIYSYDPLGRLRSVADGGSTLAEFTYNAAGRRVTSVDRSGPQPRVRHFPTRDFDWDQTRRLAHTHLWLDGARIATQVGAYPPQASGPGPSRRLLLSVSKRHFAPVVTSLRCG